MTHESGNYGSLHPGNRNVALLRSTSGNLENMDQVVPWSVLNGDLVEEIVGVMLCREFPNARRVRPAQGDRGLDVIIPMENGWEVYQVKSHTEKLTSRQRSGIKDSLREAIASHVRDAEPSAITSWHLTLPYHHLPAEFDWFEGMIREEGPPFPCDWRGLDFVNSLAARYSDVIDYYVRAGKDRLDLRIKELASLRALGDFSRPSSTGALVEPGDVTEKLSDLIRSLNRDDPHYRYDVEVLSSSVHDYRYVPRENLVMTALEGTEDITVAYHVYARYNEATKDRPIPLSFTLDPAAMDEDTREQFQASLIYGSEVTIPGDAVTALELDAPAGLDSGGTPTQIWFGANSLYTQDLGPARWAVIPPDSTDVIAELEIEVDRITRGYKGGAQIVGHDTTGAITVEFTVGPPVNDGKRPIQVSFNMAPIISLAGKPVGQALPCLRWVSAFRSPNRLAIAPKFAPLNNSGTLSLPDNDIDVSTELNMIEALQSISDHLGEFIPLPDLSNVSVGEYRNLLAVANIIRGGQQPLPPRQLFGAFPLDGLPQINPEGNPFVFPWAHKFKFVGSEFEFDDFAICIPNGTFSVIEDASPPRDGFVVLRVEPLPETEAFMALLPADVPTVED